MTDLSGSELRALWCFHDDGRVVMRKDSEGRFYVLVYEDVATHPDKEVSPLTDECTSTEGPFRTEQAADMAFGDAVHRLFRQLTPTVTEEHLSQLLDANALHGGMDCDAHGRFHGTLESGWQECTCDCEYCDTEHEACTESPPCGRTWLLTPQDARRAVGIHGRDTTAVVGYLQQVVDGGAVEALKNDRDLIEEGIPTELPALITDPGDLARILEAEAAARRT